MGRGLSYINQGQERNQISNYQRAQELEKGKFVFNTQKFPDDTGLGKPCSMTKRDMEEKSPKLHKL